MPFPRVYRIAAFAAATLVVLGVLAAIFYAPLERAIVLGYVRNATGWTIDVDSLEHVNGELAFAGVRAESANGSLALSADRIVYHRDDAGVALSFARPHLVVHFEQHPAAETQSLLAAARTHGFGQALRLAVSDGTIDASGLGSAGVPWSLGVHEVDGSAAFASGRVSSYDLSGALADGAARYPFEAHAATDAGGLRTTFSAATLPLGTLGALLPASNVSFRGGQLTGVTLSASQPADKPDDPQLHGTAHMEDAELALNGAVNHTLRGLHGDLVLDGDGLGSQRLSGSLDGIPLDATGEVHGLPANGSWLFDGTNDLRSLAQLLASIADQPRVQSIHLETTAPGLAFAQFALSSVHGPLAVQVLALDPREPTLRFDTAIAGDRVISGGERTSAMGVRTGAVAGVNGDYFDIGRTYQPQGMLIRNGELVRGPTDRMALVIHRDRSVTFDEFRLRGTLHAARGNFPVTQLNNWPAGDVTVITPAFGKELPAAQGVTFAALEPLPEPHHYRVSRVTSASSPQPVSFGVAFGPLAHAELHEGETVTLDYALDPRVDDAVAGIGGGPLLLRDGEWYDDPHAPAPDERDVRWPVIALGRTVAQNLLLVAVDGRHPERSIGMTRPEFADLLHDLGVVEAMALDSGGSVTMVSRAPGDSTVTVRNVPSDSSSERWVSDALFVYSSAPAPAIVTAAAAPTPVPEVRPSP